MADTDTTGNMSDPIAICGLSLKFPQDATSPEAFWKMMLEKRCAMTEFPADRLNADGFYQEGKKLQTLPLRGAHFVKDDLSVFDAEFFTISPAEAMSMDPMQRWLLEVTYAAFENAGMTMESMSGTQTAVYTGSFSLDYMLQLTRDPECPPTYAAVGFGLSLLANRLSWFFNLHGPSIGLDSACSSTAMALDIACKSLRDGSCSTAVVAGANIATSPESYIWMSNINFLSSDSRCYSFDHRANGYARGEGIGVVILKRLSDAIRDGNTIRAVIRASGSNEDGRTPGITQPSSVAQERLIRATYRKAGLSMKHTRFFEAHGTGTQAGDPREALAIGSAFRDYRTTEDPLYIGAVKSNIGHLEGASGLAAVIKTVLALERGVIPPNTNFEKVNPKIDTEYLHVRFPAEATPWPESEIRRASINSFGFGGANSHIVLDDAYSYLRLKSSQSLVDMRLLSCSSFSSPKLLNGSGGTNGYHEEANQRLFVWSSADKGGIQRLLKAYQNWYKTLPQSGHTLSDQKLLGNLAHTLNNHRSHLPWRSYATLSSLADIEGLEQKLSDPVKASSTPLRLGFVFTGQGAQWFAMGRELLSFPTFKDELEAASVYIGNLGCQWSVIDELLKSKDDTNINNAEYSQTLCTVLQVAIVNLLRRFDVWPKAVVGHSSGEIAAAYAAGYISCESAWKAAYYRGVCSALLLKTESSETTGSMMSVGLSPTDLTEIVRLANKDATAFGVTIACINSPSNVTISGETHLIDHIKVQLDDQDVFSRKLSVNLAYHSKQMEAVSEKYVTMVGSLSKPESLQQLANVPMISSVTGKSVDASVLIDASYWAKNMVSPVLFSQAVSNMCAKAHVGPKKIDRSHNLVSAIDHLVEIGPHAALQGPITQILRASTRGSSVGYSSILRRGLLATDTMLETLGSLHCKGALLNFKSINEPRGEATRSLVVDLPEYPFDHSQHYWYESRLSRNYRFRSHAPSELLGVRSRDWNPADAKWRHFLRLKEMPWMEQHVVNGKTLYPGSGMLVMALEAAKQVLSDGPNGDKITGYTLRDVHLDAPIDLANAGPEGLEVQTSLRERQASHGNDAASFDFTVRTYANDHWRVNCRGQVHVELSEPTAEGHEDSKLQTEAERRQFRNNVSEAIASCESEVDSSFMYSYLKINKYDYGPHFQAAQHQRCNRQKRQASSQTKLFDTLKEEHLIHPVSLDAILHLSFTALTSGGARPMATSVPSYIASLWISSKGLNSFDNYMAPTQTTINEWTGRGFTCNGAALGGADNEELRLWYDGLQLTNITASPPSLELPSPHQYCMTIETQVALDKLGHSEVQNLLADLHPADDDNVKFWEDTEKIIETCLEKLAASVNLEDVIQDPGAETWKVQYSKWALHHLTRLRLKRGSDSSLPVSETPITELCERIGNSNRVGRLYVTVAETLESLFSRELAPLETLMQTGLLRDYYAELCTYRCMWQAATYLGLLSHQKPGMKILEVGGGTASATRKFLATLAGGSGNADGVGSADKLSSLRCSRYDFTDVSASFLEKARLEFAPYQAQMTFGTLDIERDFAEQGYEDNSYDVIVADGVLHVTYDLKQTLTNARKALKPGGKLIMPELLKSDGWTAGFVFGLFPGWWFATSEDRQLSPNLSASEWDAVLRETGFSGGDVVLTDFDADVAHHLGCIISTAVPFEPVPSAELSTEQRATILFDQTSEKQRLLAEELVEPMRSTLGIEAVLEPTDFETPRQDSRESQSEELIVFLADFGSSSFVANMNETTWTYMKSLVRTSNKLLWVSSGGGTPDASNPDNGVLDGLTRTLRTEFYELHLVLVALDDTGSSTVGRASTHLVQVTQEMLTRESGAGYEQDYMEMGGLLHTRRLVGAGDIKTSMDERLLPYKEVLMNTDEARFQLSTKTFLGTDDDNANWISLPKAEELSREHLEVQIKAVSMLQPHSREGALIASSSPLSHHGGSIGIGNFYAGVVNQIGSGVSSVFQTGDRVFGSRPHDVSLRSHLEVNTSGIARIPPTLSFEEACSLLPPTVLAYHAMVEVSQIKPSHRVLIHSAMTQVGQAALRVLTDRGVTNIWAMTEVGEDEGRAWVSRHLGNTEEDRHIPQNWLSRDSMLLSKWKRHFDVVFVPLGDMNAALTNLVRPGGRYVTLISSPSDKNSLRDLQSLPVDTSLSVIQAQYLAPSEEALRYAVEHLSPAQPAEVSSMGHGGQRQFLGSELVSLIPPVKDSSDNEVKDQVKVRVANPPSLQVNPDATYVIAGGLGGLGRAMARWLVSRGARYLILLSRSGPRSNEARALISECEKKGVRVECPACDISNRDGLKEALAICSASSDQQPMPPIKGCIQSSMVMTERIFEQMDFSHWKATVDPKIQGSWNLHHELPRDLDFFVFISSMMGILGSGSLTAYNAGNTFQDALATYRVSRGEHAATLNLGAVPDAGYLVENSHHIPTVLRASKYAPTYVADLFALLDIYCESASGPTETPHALVSTAHAITARHRNDHQVVIGIRPPSHWRHVEEVPWALQQPFWGHMHHIPIPPDVQGLDGDIGGDDDNMGDGASGNSYAARRKRVTEAVGRLAAVGDSGSLGEAAEAASEALALRVAGLLGASEDRAIDEHKPMRSYGLDSLTALDVRNWVLKIFGVDLPVFEILGDITFASAGNLIAHSMQQKHQAAKASGLVNGKA